MTDNITPVTFGPTFHFKGVRFFPLADRRAVELVESFEVRDDDIFISAYIKSGTTWVQQIVSLLSTEGDLSEVNKIPIFVRVPWLETMDQSGSGEPMPKVLRDAPSPRLMKTHMPYHMLPEQAREGKGKIIYCARNVKDVVVSWHKMREGMDLPGGTFDENFQEFINPEQAAYGFWWDVVPEYWRHKDDKNMLFLKFEAEPKEWASCDLRGNVVKIANFLGKTPSDQRIDEVVSYCTFSAMRDNDATNFVRDKAFKGRRKEGFEFMRKDHLSATNQIRDIVS
ncbi:PREDICTED: sulfotransferase 1A1-like [Branchiostoma belcheri]|uniref:Sulfotransferase n=1 Tax=Branchiostoma belcheri TaxID=7741 RepID=A0A6P4ZUJ0_BRABE|nr:PREDICTED: sulfotransferase 1A1-like [Branchiostoma belcheri]